MRRLVVLGVVLAAGAASAQPVPGPDRAYAPPVATRTKLASGLSLLVVERRTVPMVDVLLVIPGAGAAADPAGKGGLAAFTADLVDEGSGGRDALAVARAAEALGATLRSWADRRAAYVAMSTLARTFEPSLELLAEVVARPAFAPKEVKRVHGDRMTALALRRDRPREIAALRLDAALFGAGSPEGHPMDGEVASVRRLGAADARAFHAATWDPAAATLIVVGDVRAAEVARAVEARLGAWRRGIGAPPRPMPAGRAAPTRLVLVDRPGAQQSDVVFGVPAIAPSDPQAAAWEVVLNAFGGGFTGRLTQVLRERLGYLYHVYPELEYAASGGGRYTVLAPLFTPKTADGLKEIVAMVDDLAANGLPPAELEKARKNLVRDLPERFETNGATARTVGELALLGLPDTYYATYGARVGAVPSADAQAVARERLARKLVFAIVGDLAKVRAAVEALGLGVPEVYDLTGRRVR